MVGAKSLYRWGNFSNKWFDNKSEMKDHNISTSKVMAKILNEKVCLLPKVNIENANTPKTTQRVLIMEKNTCIY